MPECRALDCPNEAAGGRGIAVYCADHLAGLARLGNAEKAARERRPPTCQTNYCTTRRPVGKGSAWICDDCKALFRRAKGARELIGRDPAVDPELVLTYVIAPPC